MKQQDSIFTKIRKGEIPGFVLYEDEVCFVILTVQPHHPGHVLVVPIKEVVDWQDVEAADWTHLMQVAQFFARAIKNVYKAPKIALAAVGFHVQHVHIHVFSLFKFSDIDHDTAKEASQAELKKSFADLKSEINRLGGVKTN